MLFMLLFACTVAIEESKALKWEPVNSPDPSMECYKTFYDGHHIVCIEKQ